ncbi:MAG: CAAX prenyl protease-related protein [Candidatus Methylacidiphilales bacterium]
MVVAMSESWVKHPAWPYFLPLLCAGVFIALRDVASVYWLYPLQTVAVAGLIGWGWKRFPKMRPERLGGSILVGVAGFVLWVGLDPILVQHPEPRGGFDPWSVSSGAVAVALVIIRILGASLVVPIMEEVFWRGCLMRYLIKEDFESVPLGSYTHLSFWVTTAAFASVHGAQWVLAVPVGIFYGWWFVRTKTLGDVIVAHGVTNLLLGGYVVVTGRWYFW